MNKKLFGDDGYKLLYINNLIYDKNIQNRLKSNNKLYTSDILKIIRLLIEQNETNFFIDEHVKEKFYILVNYCRFDCEKDLTKKDLYDACNKIIIYLNQKSKKNLFLDSYQYYFNQTIIRNIDPYFCYGSASYYAKNRDLLYETIYNDLLVYQALKIKNFDFNKLLTNNKEIDLKNICMFTYSIRALNFFYSDVFDSDVIINNLKQLLIIEQYNLEKYILYKQEPWYMELCDNIKTLMKVIDERKY